MKETVRLTNVPRRANKVAQIAAETAAKQVSRALRRQEVSDKISYAIAVTIGVAAGYFAWWAALAVVGYYAVSAARFYRKYKHSLATA